ncbi:MAG: rRNA maturation RNase YbeY [Rhodocyclaceae bacterium]|nr:rRNA maturation RNase YbeY [Rhodocyclaceae bacterium]MBX3669031.1 rRNA maturation RNase YbeY [Rhodocyclaceae bacterium]
MRSRKPATKAPLRLSLAVQYACGAAELPPRARLRAWVSAALSAARPASAQLTLRFVDAEEGRALNRDYRDRDYATNVLTFIYAGGENLAGDVVLCVPVLVREAAEQNKSLLAHCAHLVVHGLLHMQDYDHERGDAEAEEMETLERSILARLGFDDPYAAPDALPVR